MSPMRLDLDVVATRGHGARAAIEARHRVHGVAVTADGGVVAEARDPALVTWWRSCAKFFQLMPFLEAGGEAALAWGDDELALACASHGGEPEHLTVAARMLRDLGREAGDLACGPHEPLSARGERLWRASGQPLTRLHNNCSGKHAAMLAAAPLLGAATTGYERAGHPVQVAALGAVAVWTGVRADLVLQGVDGCGTVVHGLPLTHMALAYARLGASAEKGHDVPARLVAAVRRRPHLLGGTDRFDTVLLEETAGAAIAKVGAEGVHTVMVPSRGLGLCVKVEDGALRAQHAAVVAALQALEVLPEALPPRLQDFLVKPVRNTRGEVVGAVGPHARWVADGLALAAAASNAPVASGA